MLAEATIIMTRYTMYSVDNLFNETTCRCQQLQLPVVVQTDPDSAIIVGGQTRTVPRVKSYHGKLFFKTHTTIPPRKMTQALSRFWIYFLELITMWSTEIAIT